MKLKNTFLKLSLFSDDACRHNIQSRDSTEHRNFLLMVFLLVCQK